MRTRTSSEIRSSLWSVGCESLDRDYGDWDAYKALLPMLGVKHARFVSGWAKTEQQKGIYDFSWLDRQIRECAAMGVRPWVCLAYGNPVWGSDFRLGMRVRQITDDTEAFEAWLRYCRACVARYADAVDEWEIWNEPFRQSREYAELFLRTARVIREVQPSAQCFCTALAWNDAPDKNDYVLFLERLKAENALDLAGKFIYHPYTHNPDNTYRKGPFEDNCFPALELRKLVKRYSGNYDILQGEAGCPAQLEFAHALANVEWSEYSQAKWNLRRAIGDAVRSIPSNLFTMIDLQYTFMLQSFGLVRSNALKEFVYRRPSWYAMRNVYAIFDDETHPKGFDETPDFPIAVRADPRETGGRTLSHARFVRFDRPLNLYWFSEGWPNSKVEFDRIALEVPDEIADPVWVEMISGRVFGIPADKVVRMAGRTTLKDIAMWDSPVLIADRSSVK